MLKITRGEQLVVGCTFKKDGQLANTAEFTVAAAILRNKAGPLIQVCSIVAGNNNSRFTVTANTADIVEGRYVVAVRMISPGVDRTVTDDLLVIEPMGW